MQSSRVATAYVSIKKHDGASMNSLLLTQLFSAYIVLALSFNIISVICEEVAGRRASPNDPMTGVLFVTVLYVTYSVGPQVSPSLYLFILVVFALFMFRYGVLRHLVGFDTSAYYSRFTWASAFLINIYGVIILAIIIASIF